MKLRERENPLRATLRVCLRHIAFGSCLLVLPALLLPEAPMDPFRGGLAPGLAHFLGTDDLGRDALLRLLLGTARSLGFASASALLALVLALFLTLWGSRLRGAGSALRSAPPLLWLLPLAAATGGMEWLPLALLIAMLLSLHLEPPLRAGLAPLLNGPAWSAGQVMGASPLQQVASWAPVFSSKLEVLLPTAWLGALWAEATLSTLGLGPGPEKDSLGRLLQEELPRLATDPTPLGWAALGVVVALAWGATPAQERP
jgi:peptide/nickel transport system permease protein